MNPERWERIKELFGSALEKEPAEREAFLIGACGEDASLHAELKSLLASYGSERSASFPQSGEVADLAGRRIGPYEVQRRIGAGGMGAVYLAVRADDVYSKQVALKVVQADIDAQELVHRFRHERQILATLDHPNIAKLLDGGTTDAGLPYFVMDYVEGTRIDEYCERHALPLAARIELFRGVCSAVQYVHQNLVVHRDLKPANILVTAEGVPKLLDFGIAKLVKPEFFRSALDATRVEFRLMTPGYASPEQVRGEPVTTASDVYSLGVILFELLTSQRPYRLETDSPLEVLRAVCDQEPTKPSATARSSDRLRRQLAGDLDNIVLKALRKEPDRRYATPEQLSEDLRRHQRGLPVSAHRDSWSYRTRKFVGRHRAGVAAAGLVTVSLLGGVLATAWQAAKAQRQFNDVRHLATSFLFDFDRAIQNLPGSTPARQLVVERALEYLSKLAEESRGDRKLEQDLVEAYLKVGDVQGNPYGPNLGDSSGAAKSYGRALEISTRLTRAVPDDLDSRRYLARSYKSLGSVLTQLGKPTEAKADFEQAVRILEPLAPEGGPDLRAELASCYQMLGDVQGHAGLQNLGDPAGALESYRKALALYRALPPEGEAGKAARRGLALVQIRIGDLQEGRDDLAAALSAYRAAFAISDKLAAEDPANADDQRRLAFAYRKTAGMQESLNDLPGALEGYVKASAINEALMKADPANAQAQMSYAISLRWTGDLLSKMRDRSGAIARYRQVLAILDRLSAQQPDNVLVAGRRSEMMIVLARALEQSGEKAEARVTASHGLALARELARREDATPDDLSQVALDFLTCEPADLREPATALTFAERAVALSGGSDADGLDVLAQAYFDNGASARAIETERRALALLSPSESDHQEQPARRRIEAHLAAFSGRPPHGTD